MGKKILFVANISIHFRAFHLPYMAYFKQNGWEVHAASGDEDAVPYCDKVITLPLKRSPWHLSNIQAVQMLKALIDAEKYDIIHCHTPMGGVVARIAARAARSGGTKVIYTCHGAHFYTGAPLMNWLVYYPVERYFAKRTDCLITINHEDFHRMRSFKAVKVCYVPGVGIDTEKFVSWSQEDRGRIREAYGYGDEDWILLYAGELSKRKNQSFLLQVMAALVKESPRAKLLLAGEGPMFHHCHQLAEALEIQDKVEFLGFRTDLAALMAVADVYVAGSRQEGLAVNVLEALACGLPVVATRARGQSDVIAPGVNGYVVAPGDVSRFVERLIYLKAEVKLRAELGKNAVVSVVPFTLDAVKTMMVDIYKEYM